MYTSEPTTAPQAKESLSEYVRRLRDSSGWSQQQLAEAAGIHLQSLGKIERGQTLSLNDKTRNGLAVSLKIPVEYLLAAERGEAPALLETLKLCPHCWVPGHSPDPLWLNPRAKFCCLCGTQLRDRCGECGEAIASFKHRFCPHCGKPYKPNQNEATPTISKTF